MGIAERYLCLYSCQNPSDRSTKKTGDKHTQPNWEKVSRCLHSLTIHISTTDEKSHPRHPRIRKIANFDFILLLNNGVYLKTFAWHIVFFSQRSQRTSNSFSFTEICSLQERHVTNNRSRKPATWNLLVEMWGQADWLRPNSSTSIICSFP